MPVLLAQSRKAYLASTESYRKEMHRTQNVRRSGVSVVPRTDLKTEGEQPNNRETGYREYRFKRNSRWNDWWEWMFERMMRFESNLRYGSVDWVLGLLLFYLIYLLSFFPRTSTAWDQAPQWGEKAKKISEKAKKNRSAKRPAER